MHTEGMTPEQVLALNVPKARFREQMRKVSTLPLRKLPEFMHAEKVLSASVQVKLARIPDAYLHSVLARRTDLLPRTQRILAEHTFTYAWEDLAANPLTIKEVRVDLREGTVNKKVLNALGSNPSLEIDEVDWMYAQKNTVLDAALIRRSDLTDSMRDSILARGADQTYTAACLSGRMSDEFFEKAFLKGSYVQEYISQNKYLPRAVAQKLIDLNHEGISVKLVPNESLSEDLRVQLLRQSPSVCWELARFDLPITAKERSIIWETVISSNIKSITESFGTRSDVTVKEAEVLYHQGVYNILRHPVLPEIMQSKAAQKAVAEQDDARAQALAYNPNITAERALYLLNNFKTGKAKYRIMRVLAGNKYFTYTADFPAKCVLMRTDDPLLQSPPGVDADTWTALLNGWSGTIRELEEVARVLGPAVGNHA